MPAISRLIVVQPDPRIAEAVRFGFEREGTRVISLSRGDAVASALAKAAGSAGGPGGAPGGAGDGAGGGKAALPELAVAGAGSADAARDLLGDVRQALDEAGARVPILFLGDALGRRDALDAGASERLPHPVFVRDLVTVSRLLVTARRREPLLVEGQLSDYGGVLYLIRAMVAMQRTGVLSLVRGLRRGELRFYEGEVTSAQVGVLHGMAALHQILLWTRAHFELRDEAVMRRRQIPLMPEEILADAEHFVSELRAVAGTLVPSMVYEPDRERLKARKRAIPRPVQQVLKLIDGYRTMGDVVEDSPYRVLETLQIANRLVETGLIRSKAGTQARGSAPGIPGGASEGAPEVPIERWLADQYAERFAAAIGSVELEPLGGRPLFGEDDEEDEPEAPPTGASARSKSEGEQASEWADILPTEMVSGFSPVVPSTEAAGEILSVRDMGALAPVTEGAGIMAEGAVAEAASASVPEDGAPRHEMAFADTAPVQAVPAAAARPSAPAAAASAPRTGVAQTRDMDADSVRASSLWQRIFRKPPGGGED